MTINKTSSGYQVRSEGGRNLSAPDLSKGQAERRLQQVEYFKHRGMAEGGMVHVNPSDKQKAAGNYQKGHLVAHGMRISVENPAGSERSGVDPAGKAWTQRLAHDYGYVRGMIGKDKDKIDVFLGPRAGEPDAKVFVVDQNKKGGGGDFDEHKAMLGFEDEDDAIMAYHRNYEPGWDGFRAVTAMSPQEFRDWGYAGRSGKRKPASEYAAFKEKEDGTGQEGGGEAADAGDQDGRGQEPDGGREVRAAGAVLRGGTDAAGTAGRAAAQGGGRGQGDAGSVQPAAAVPGLLPSGRAVGSGAQPRGVRTSDRQDANPGSGAQPRAMATGPAGAGRAERPDGNAGHVVQGGGGQDPQDDFKRGGHVPEAGGLVRAVQPQQEGAGGRRPRSLGERLAAKQGYAKGGAVPERGDDHEGRAAFGVYPRSGKRRESANDRRASASNPASLLRGLLAGTAGLPGDLEGLVRTIASATRGNPVSETLGKSIPGLGLLQTALGSSPDTTARLPTSEFYNEYLPGRAEGASNRAFENVGNVGGLMPGEVAGLAGKGARAAAPALKTALTSAIEAGGPQLERAIMKAAPLARPMYAVKEPGGNWAPGSVERAVNSVTDYGLPSEMNSPVNQWLDKRLSKYVRNEMGTARDPLLQLEKEGRLHMSPEQLNQRLEGVYGEDYGNGLGDYPGNKVHTNLTGRKNKTAWEALTDANVEPMTAAKAASRAAAERGGAPEWLVKAGNEDPTSQVYNVQDDFRDLDFGHVRDYLKAATRANKGLADYGSVEALRGIGNEEAADFVARGLHIDPEKLPMMSLPDVIRKTADWNDMLAKAKELKDVNKGVKSVLKQYEDSGHQWVELDKEGLAGEGSAMGHCVGGYCDSVEGGNTRILSLRDKKGQPHVTVELGRGLSPGPEVINQLPRGWVRAREEAEAQAIREGYTPSHKEWEDVVQDIQPEVETRMIEEHNAALKEDAPWNILQIKGKGNLAPIAEYQPAVQDLVRNMGPWGPDIQDFHNTGLIRRSEPGRHKITNLSSMDAYTKALEDLPNELTTEDEIYNHLVGKGWGRDEAYVVSPEDMQNPDNVEMLKNAADYHRKNFKGRYGYAQGGTVANRQTVGLGQFGAAQQPEQQVQQSGGGWGFQGGLGGGSMGQPGLGGAGGQQAAPGLSTWGDFANGLPTAANTMEMGQGGAPTYSDTGLDDYLAGYKNPFGSSGTGIQAMDPGINMTLLAGNQGFMHNAANAFLGTYNPVRMELDNTGEGGTMVDRGEGYGAAWDLANRMGLANKYTGMSDARMYENLNKDLGNYYSLSGLSSGWSGKGDPRGASTTLYLRQNGKLVPVSKPRNYTAAENPGWIRGRGAETITALSMMLPAVGGWAGLAGQAAGTGGATAANLAGNAALGYARGGEQGALSSLAGGLGGVAGGAAGNAMGSGWGQAGQQFGSQAGNYLYNQSRKS